MIIPMAFDKQRFLKRSNLFSKGIAKGDSVHGMKGFTIEVDEPEDCGFTHSFIGVHNKAIRNRITAVTQQPFILEKRSLSGTKRVPVTNISFPKIGAGTSSKPYEVFTSPMILFLLITPESREYPADMCFLLVTSFFELAVGQIITEILLPWVSLMVK